MKRPWFLSWSSRWFLGSKHDGHLSPSFSPTTHPTLSSSSSSLLFLVRFFWRLSSPSLSSSSSSQGVRRGVGLQRDYHVAYFGSDVFSIQLLHSLLLSSTLPTRFPIHQWTIVVPQRTQQVGRDQKKVVPGPLEQYCHALRLPVHVVSNQELSNWKWSSSNPPDVLIAASFPYLIPSHVLTRCLEGGLNVHPSLLPKYRGPAPLHHTLMNGDPETGVTILTLDPNEFDRGEVLLQQRLKLPDYDRVMYSELQHRLVQLSSTLLIQVLMNLKEYKKHAQPQSLNTSKHPLSSYAPKVYKQMGHIHWETDTAWQLWCKWRAFHPHIPLFTYVQDPPTPKQPFRLLTFLPPFPMVNEDKEESLLDRKGGEGGVECPRKPLLPPPMTRREEETTKGVTKKTKHEVSVVVGYCTPTELWIPSIDQQYVRVTQIQKEGHPPHCIESFYHGLKVPPVRVVHSSSIHPFTLYKKVLFSTDPSSSLSSLNLNIKKN